MAPTDTPDHKDTWDKAHIVLAPLGGLFTALAVASVGFFGSQLLDRQQSTEAKLRLYSELMSKREESEAALRKDMFQSIIGSFLAGQSAKPTDGASPAQQAAVLESKVLNMELLAQNFHEALNLTPLFQHIRREIIRAQIPEQEKRVYEERLSTLAREVSRKQMVVLEAGGQRFDRTVFLDSLLAGGPPVQLEDAELTLDGITRRFRLTVLSADTAAREVKVRLEIATPAQPGISQPDGVRTDAEFQVGFFSSPMIDNTRLSNDQRVAIVLTNINAAAAELSGLYFPGSRSSLREKPYYEEILRKLADTGATGSR